MTDRYVDLLKQGFMKPSKTKRTKKVSPIISCGMCMNWHTEGKHTATKEERKQNKIKYPHCQ